MKASIFQLIIPQFLGDNSMGTKAKESPQILRARKKIAQQLIASEKQINPESLNRMRQLIEKQLERNSSERISLKKRQIVLFDENQHPAAQSKYVENILSEIQGRKPRTKKSKLLGRISSMRK
jgi:hypothetical protein